MTSRLFYKTILAIEVLSEEPIGDDMNPESIIREAIEGDFSMRELPRTATVLSGLEAAKALEEQASDPSFFQLTEEGEDDE